MVHMVDEGDLNVTLSVVLRNGVLLRGVIVDITEGDDGERYVCLDGVNVGHDIRMVWLFRDREVAATGKVAGAGTRGTYVGEKRWT